MKKITLVLMVLALGTLLTIPAFAFGPGGGRGPGNGRGYEEGYCSKPSLWNLNLSVEQKTKIEALQTAHLKDARPLRDKMFDKSVELRKLWLQTSPDKDKITAAQKELRTLRDKMEDKSTALRFEINKVLTPEQSEKLANSHWGKGPGFGPRGSMRGQGGMGHGMGMRQ
jgi:Spy/CpxP family protein refolding chaperone